MAKRMDDMVLSATSFLSQQKIASQKPRGTRMDASGTRIKLKGSRNYTPCPVFVGPDEMFEDIVLRGLRADGLSTKLGIKNNKASISKLISSLFQADARHDEAMRHFECKRQRSNSAKTIFATLTYDELKMMKNDMFPTRIDVQVRNSLEEIYSNCTFKLQHTLDVLYQLQQTFKDLTLETELLSSHNFQTRGFFLDVLIMTCRFLSQVINDVYDDKSTASCDEHGHQQHQTAKADTIAAEILLSVGSDVNQQMSPEISDRFIVPQTANDNEMTNSAALQQPLPDIDSSSQEVSAESISKEWTTVELVDNSGQSKLLLVKAPKDENGAINTDKLLEMLSNQEAMVIEQTPLAGDDKLFNIVDNPPPSSEKADLTSQSYLMCDNTPMQHPVVFPVQVASVQSQDGESENERNSIGVKNGLAPAKRAKLK